MTPVRAGRTPGAAQATLVAGEDAAPAATAPTAGVEHHGPGGELLSHDGVSAAATTATAKTETAVPAPAARLDRAPERVAAAPAARRCVGVDRTSSARLRPGPSAGPDAQSQLLARVDGQVARDLRAETARTAECSSPVTEPAASAHHGHLQRANAVRHRESLYVARHSVRLHDHRRRRRRRRTPHRDTHQRTHRRQPAARPAHPAARATAVPLNNPGPPCRRHACSFPGRPSPPRIQHGPTGQPTCL